MTEEFGTHELELIAAAKVGRFFDGPKWRGAAKICQSNDVTYDKSCSDA